MNEVALQLKDIRKGFDVGQGHIDVLNGANLDVASGELVAMVGPSGSGKSTLLHIAGLLETADGGDVLIGGEACAGLSDQRRTTIRRQTVGFVYQFHNLLPEFTALENVMFPQLVAGAAKNDAADRAAALLDRMGLSQRLEHQPAQLSGGEQQRVAIARSLANSPQVLLADEPTGNLDEGTADGIFGELLRVAREDGVAALIATHNTALADRMDRRIVLHGGIIEQH
ncbi:MAG: ABC transporter ATP-binding protein [Alphaproteobacteria bacterium]